jgi:hypothetical protein
LAHILRGGDEGAFDAPLFCGIEPFGGWPFQHPFELYSTRRVETLTKTVKHSKRLKKIEKPTDTSPIHAIADENGRNEARYILGPKWSETKCMHYPERPSNTQLPAHSRPNLKQAAPDVHRQTETRQYRSLRL